MSEEKEMSFLEHLEELRWHLVRSVVAILIFTVVIFCFPEILFDKIVFGPIHDDFLTYRILCQLGEKFNMAALCFNGLPFEKFVSLQMPSMITWHIWGSLIGGFILAFPYVAYEFWKFFKPAFQQKERKSIRGIVFIMSILFSIGVLFGYFVLCPLTVNFMGNYNVMSASVEIKPVFTSYVSTIINLVLGCGILFELPVVIYFLAKMGLISPTFLKRYRRHAIVVILILAAIITPPEVASQVLVTIPLLVLYEISIFIAKRVYKEQEA